MDLLGTRQGADVCLKKPKIAFTLLKLLVHRQAFCCTYMFLGFEEHVERCCPFLFACNPKAGELLDVLDVSPGKYPHHPPSDHRLGKILYIGRHSRWSWNVLDTGLLKLWLRKTPT